MTLLALSLSQHIMLANNLICGMSGYCSEGRREGLDDARLSTKSDENGRSVDELPPSGEERNNKSGRETLICIQEGPHCVNCVKMSRGKELKKRLKKKGAHSRALECDEKLSIQRKRVLKVRYCALE